jgi:HEPN domain-containing protein
MKRPPDQVWDEFVRGWLQKVEEDLNAAKSLSTYGETFLSTVCFHLQHAAEKYLKAFLTRHQVKFPKTHDIDELLNLVKPVNAEVSESLRDTVVLTSYGVEVRYPGERPAVTRSDAQQAVRLAEEVRAAILKSL